MADASTIVNQFLAECGEGKDQMQAAFRRFFTPTTIWENVGLVTTVGADEAIALLDQFEKDVGPTHLIVEMLSIAASGDRVLTERVDHMVADDGRRIITLRLMGIFEISGGKIAAWRDYFDTAAMQS